MARNMARHSNRQRMSGLLSSFARGALTKFRSPPRKCISPIILPPDVPLEEEELPRYNAKNFYPVNPGDRLVDRYETTAKLGYGESATVWLARDIRPWRWQCNRYVVLKVNNCDNAGRARAKRELKISKLLKETNPSHPGFQFVRIALDDFKVKGPTGTHSCLIYEPMREPIWLFRQRLKNERIPMDLLKRYLIILLYALDYLHSECHVLHTDLKMENILVTFEQLSVIDDFACAQPANPMPRKIKDGRSIYLSHNDFGPLQSYGILPKIADFDMAVHLEAASHPHVMIPIQHEYYRAPEVILGTGYTYSADIWILGVMLWNLIEDRDLFQNIHTPKGEYSPAAHLAEMIALLGPPPKDLIQREREGGNWSWPKAIENSAGKLCENANEFWGGPFFDSEDNFLHQNLIPTNLTLESTLPSLPPSEKPPFLDFVLKLLQWSPEKRKTAKELLEDPWFAGLKLPK